MNEIIQCPSCQRKLTVPENLLGQHVQCPSCEAKFVAASGDPTPAPLPSSPPPLPPSRDYSDESGYEPERARRRSRSDAHDDEDYDDERGRWYRRRDLLPHRGSTVLTLGILSLVVCGPILGPIAWVMGNTDLGEMKAGRMDPDGRSSTEAGRICGIIASILSAIGLLIACLWVVVVIGMMGAAGRR